MFLHEYEKNSASDRLRRSEPAKSPEFSGKGSEKNGMVGKSLINAGLHGKSHGNDEYARIICCLQ